MNTPRAFAGLLATLAGICLMALVIGIGTVGYNYLSAAIVSVAPTQNAAHITASDNIDITFDGNVKEASLTASTFRVWSDTTGLITCVYSVPSATVASCNPSADLPVGSLITVTITSGVTDTLDVSLTTGQVQHFTVGTTAGLAVFNAATNVTVGTNPSSIALGDFDEDGDIDAVVSNTGSSTVQLLTNNGSGTLVAGTTYATDQTPYKVILQDFDNDGSLDIAVVASTEFSVFNGNGNGTFQAKVDYVDGVDGTSNDIATTDFNKDGWLDIVVGDNTAAARIFSNDGDGTFTDYGFAYAGWNHTPVDTDADGDMDIAYAGLIVAIYGFSVSPNNNMNFMSATGRTSYYASYGKIGIGMINSAYSIVTTENRSETYPYIRLYTLSNKSEFAEYHVRQTPSAIMVNDFNGDNKNDIAVANYGGNNVSMLIGKASAAFKPAVEYATDTGPQDAAAADLDGDGSLDMVTANAAGTVSVLLNKTDQSEQANPVANAGEDQTVASGTLVTLNGTESWDPQSGILTYAWSQTSGPTVTLSSPTATSPTYTPTVAGLYEFSLTVSDGTNLSVADTTLVTTPFRYLSSTPALNSINAGTSTSVSVTFNSAPVSASPAVFMDEFLGPVSYSSEINGSSITYTLSSAFSKGAIISANMPGSMQTTDGGTQNLTPAVVQFTTAGTASSGTFATAVNETTGQDPVAIKLGDLDGDDDLDTVVVNSTDSNVQVFLNNGSGDFTSNATYSTDSTPNSITLADLDADGDLDLIIGKADLVDIRKNNGDGTFAAAVQTDPQMSTIVGMVTMDFEGDGDVDISIMDNNGIERTVLNNGTGTLSIGSGVGLGILVGTGIFAFDYSEDGRTDLILGYGAATPLRRVLNSLGLLWGSNLSHNITAPVSAVSAAKLNGTFTMVAALPSINIIETEQTNGSGTTYAVGTTPVDVKLKDLDADTYIDAIVANSGSANISVLKGKSDGTFEAAVNYAVQTNPRKLDIGDVDGDGELDIVAVNQDSNSFSVLLQVSSNEAPTITSNGGDTTAAVNAAENQTAVTTVTSTDTDLPADTLTYSITGGTDQALFSIVTDTNTGVLTFLTAPDFETPTDTGLNNTYEVTVQVSDGNGGTDTQAITVTVTNVNEAPVADAGPDQTSAVYTGQTVALDGSGSSDVDQGAVITYAWTIETAPQGSTATLSDATIGDTTFVPNVAGDYTLQLIVSDGTADSDPDTILVTVQSGGGPTRPTSTTAVPTTTAAPVVVSSGGGGGGGGGGGSGPAPTPRTTVAATTGASRVTSTTQEEMLAGQSVNNANTIRNRAVLNYYELKKEQPISTSSSEPTTAGPPPGSVNADGEQKQNVNYRVRNTLWLGTIRNTLEEMEKTTSRNSGTASTTGTPQEQLLMSLEETLKKSLATAQITLESRLNKLLGIFEGSLGKAAGQKMSTILSVRKLLHDAEQSANAGRKTIVNAIAVVQEGLSIEEYRSDTSTSNEDLITLEIKKNTIIERIDATEDNQDVIIGQPERKKAANELDQTSETSEASEMMEKAEAENIKMITVEIPIVETVQTTDHNRPSKAGHKLSKPANLKVPMKEQLSNPIVITFYGKSGDRKANLSSLKIINTTAIIKTDTLTIFSLLEVEDAIALGYISPAPTFTDLTESYAWSAPYVTELANRYIVSGKSEGRFAPGENITRAELTKIALLNFGYTIDPESTISGFTDMSDAHWSAATVRRGRETAIISGYADGTFRPDQPVTRAEAMKIILGAAQLEIDENIIPEEPFEGQFAVKESKKNQTVEEMVPKWAIFPDVYITEWYTPYIIYAANHNIVSGYADGTFGPGKPITRAEVAKIAANVWNYVFVEEAEQKVSYQSVPSSKSVATETDHRAASAAIESQQETSWLSSLWSTLQSATASIFDWMGGMILQLGS